MAIDLIPADPKLAEWWHEARQDPETIRFNPQAPSTIESLRERLSQSSSDLNEYAKADSYFWAVQFAHRIIGTVSLQNINRMMHTAEIGYGVCRSVRGKGFGSMAVERVARNVFDLTPIRKLIAFVHEENRASRRLLEKVGFCEEGLLREHYLVNGEAVNEVIYGLLKKDLPSHS